MTRFLLLALLILLVTAPEFFATEYFIVEAITDGVITLEPISINRDEHHLYTYDYQFLDERKFPDVSEGTVVVGKMWGNRLITIAPDASRTKTRQDEIAAILVRLIGTTPDSD